jgi:hypothetical protein
MDITGTGYYRNRILQEQDITGTGCEGVRLHATSTG